LNPEVQLEGTWAYQAPESWNTEAVISPAGDIYSFGVVLYELITGRTPFHATTREEWSRVHWEKQPRPPMDFLLEGVNKAIMSLALRCLQKKPEDRPQDFAAVLDEINQLARDYDYLESIMLLMQSLRMMYAFESMSKELKPNLIASLFDLQMYDLALEELDTISEELFTGELWQLRGNALSLSDRDEEALSAFEKALQSDLTDEQRYLCLSDAALSLKRLSRFQEAIHIYEDLLVQVPDNMQARIISNLSTVYLANNQPKEAARRLQLYMREHPEHPDGWVNLGQSYRQLDRYEEAVKCFQRALALAPDMAVVQVMLGEVYMDHLGRLEEAATAFELAWDQGYSSYDWFVRFLTCNILLDRKEVVDGLIAVARRDLSEAEFSEFEADTLQLIQKITGPIPPELQLQAHHMQEPVRMGEDEMYEETMDEAKVTFSAHDQRKLQADQQNTKSHLHIQFYLGGGYSVDYYDDLTMLDDYMVRFLRCWRELTRDPSFPNHGGMLSGTPFYFTICPNCSIPILTNREHGKPLTCLRCESIHETSAVRREELDELLDRIMTKLGKQLVDISGHILVLGVFLTDENKMEKIEGICRKAGFDPLPKKHLIVLSLLQGALDRGIYNFDQPYSAWQKVSAATYRVYADETPPEVQRVVRTIRENMPEVNSMSTTYNPTIPLGLAIHIGKEATEEYLRQTFLADPGSKNALMDLISILIGHEKYEEALEKALAATRLYGDDAQSWALLGHAEARCGRFNEAVEALEKALALNPVDHHHTFLLAHCYQELGDDVKAGALFARSQSLGGWIEDSLTRKRNL
jgi:tetratricopeptide (TPR) repeat protein